METGNFRGNLNGIGYSFSFDSDGEFVKLKAISDGADNCNGFSLKIDEHDVNKREYWKSLIHLCKSKKYIETALSTIGTREEVLKVLQKN